MADIETPVSSGATDQPNAPQPAASLNNAPQSSGNLPELQDIKHNAAGQSVGFDPSQNVWVDTVTRKPYDPVVAAAKEAAPKTLPTLPKQTLAPEDIKHNKATGQTLAWDKAQNAWVDIITRKAYHDPNAPQGKQGARTPTTAPEDIGATGFEGISTTPQVAATPKPYDQANQEEIPGPTGFENVAAATSGGRGLPTANKEDVKKGLKGEAAVGATIATLPFAPIITAGIAAAGGGGLLQSVGTGGGMGFLNSVAEDIARGENPVEFHHLNKTAQQTVLGMVIGALFHGAGEVLGPEAEAPVGEVTEQKPGYIKQVMQGKQSAQPELQSKVRQQISELTPSKEPNWAYRVQPAGTKSVMPGSSAQFTSDPEWAQDMAENKPIYPGMDHEVAKIDLNKLNPEDYTSTTEQTPIQKNGEPATWTRVHRQIDRDEMQIHSRHPFDAEATPVEAEAPVAPETPATAKVSLRKIMQDSIDKGTADYKALYKPIDDAAGTNIGELYDKLDAAKDRIRPTAPGSVEEAKAQTDIDKCQDAIDEAKHEAMFPRQVPGKPPVKPVANVDATLKAADAKFTETQANKDFAAKVLNRPGVVKGNIEHNSPESFDVDTTIDALESMDKPDKYGKSRLQQTSLGKDGAFKLKQAFYDAQKQGEKAVSRQRLWKWIGGLAGASTLVEAGKHILP